MTDIRPEDAKLATERILARYPPPSAGTLAPLLPIPSSSRFPWATGPDPWAPPDAKEAGAKPAPAANKDADKPELPRAQTVVVKDEKDIPKRKNQDYEDWSA